MKKILRILVIALAFSLIATTAVFAETGKGNPTGEVLTADETGGTITILTTDGDELIITVPEDFDFTSVAEGMIVTAKGDWTDTGFEAEWVKEADTDDTEGEPEVEGEEGSEEAGEEGGEGNAWGEGGVYCAGGKENAHPVAEKIAEKFGVTTEWVMEYACDGHGFGGVMLALQTQEAGGDSAEEALEKRKNGNGWGQIWKESGLVGSEKAGTPPPGLLKKTDKQTGPPEGKGPDKDKEKGPNPNSNGKGPNKDKNADNTGEDDPDGD